MITLPMLSRATWNTRRRLCVGPLAIRALPCVAAPAHSYIYWTQGNGSSGPIGRASIDSTRVNKDFITRASSTGIAVNGAHIYWTNDWNDHGTIGRASLDGTGVDQRFITGATSPVGIAVDRAHLYWANYDGTIGRANLGSARVNQRLMSNIGASDIAVDALGPTGPPPTGPVKTGVYINCQNKIGANRLPTQTLVPLQHPKTCVVFGQPESIATLYPLVHARWTGWANATTTVDATWDNPSPREGSPSPIRAKAFRIRRGCGGRRFYTRVAFPGAPHAIVLHLSAACKLPPL